MEEKRPEENVDIAKGRNVGRYQAPGGRSLSPLVSTIPYTLYNFLVVKTLGLAGDMSVVDRSISPYQLWDLDSPV